MLQKFKERNAASTIKSLSQAGQPTPQNWAGEPMMPDWNSWMFGTGMPNQFGLESDNYGLNFLDALNSQMPG